MSALTPGTRIVAWTLRDDQKGSAWSRAGYGKVNTDGSIELALDILPLTGRLHLRSSHEPDPITVRCPICESANRPDAQFCGRCGKQIAQKENRP